MPQRLMKHLNIITRCASLYRDQQLEAWELTGYQAPYLPEICNNPGIAQEALAERLHVNRSSVTRQLALLEKKGYLTRRRSETDRRMLEVYPTARMQEALPVVRQCFRDWRALLTSGLTAEELSTLEALTERLARQAEDIV